MSDPARDRGTVSELKIPAQAEFVIVAKRAAAALGSCAGFSLDGIDDLNIAIAQACEKAIDAGDRTWGVGNGVLKLTFRLVDGGMEVEIKNQPVRASVAEADAARREAEVARRADNLRRAAERVAAEINAEREAEARARADADRLARLMARRRSAGVAEAVTMDEVAVNVIGLFVDDLRYHVDSHGAMRVRMVKYRVD